MSRLEGCVGGLVFQSRAAGTGLAKPQASNFGSHLYPNRTATNHGATLFVAGVTLEAITRCLTGRRRS